MGISDLKKMFVVALCIGIQTGCFNRPATDDERVTRVDLALRSPVGVWFTNSNAMTGGYLGRIDVQTGQVTHEVRLVRPDTNLFSDFGMDNRLDQPQGLFLIMKGGNDSVALTAGSDGRVVGQAMLDSGFLTQSAARDALGQVWIAGFNSNQVQVYNSDLSKKVGSVNLAALVKDIAPVKFASFSQMAPLGKDHMVVTGQRHKRRPKAWQPNAKPGMAIINIRTLKPDVMTTIDGPGPIRLVSRNSEMKMVASGDTSPVGGHLGGFNRLSFSENSSGFTQNYQKLNHTILDAHVTSLESDPAYIAWYRSENQNCIQIGDKQILCEPGSYQFSKIIRVENTLFVSVGKPGVAEIWIITFDLESDPIVKRIQVLPTALPVIGLAVGP